MDKGQGDRQRFAATITVCAEHYDKTVTPINIKLFFDTLIGKYSIEEIEEAFRNHLMEPDRGRWFPRIADIVFQIEKRGLKPKEKANLAWDSITDALETCKSVCPINDEVAVAVIKAMGGWQNFCTSTYRELIWIKKDFIEKYLTYQKAHIDLLSDEWSGSVSLSGTLLPDINHRATRGGISDAKKEN